jgi:glycosyltransferase involved in cell wall biosynthesis
MTFDKISVLVPTRKRIERLKVLLESYAVTTRGAGHFSELVFRVDDDDVETKDFLLGQEANVRVVVGPRHQGYQSMPQFFNELFANSTGDVLMCGNDDMVFKTLHWAPRLLSRANNFPDGLFDLGVTTHNEDHYPFSVISRRAAEHLGFLWDPRIYWGDIFLRDIMAWFGRTVMLPEVQIDHDWVGFEPDLTFVEGDQNDIYRRDPTYWAGTHATAVAEAVAKLKELT